MSDEASIDHMLLAVAEKIKCQGQDHMLAYLSAGVTPNPFRVSDPDGRLRDRHRDVYLDHHILSCLERQAPFIHSSGQPAFPLTIPR